MDGTSFTVVKVFDKERKYGFRIANKGCCGTGTIEVAFLCKCPCPDVYNYVFWDSFHPIETTYRILVHQLDFARMVHGSVLNDALKSLFNAEKKGKREVMIRPSPKVKQNKQNIHTTLVRGGHLK
ncbi:hypothetical protein POM88_027201 [Heracleum sosnowskyi]|uniref:Uncharacterized protein n=1 Tax=Heracleum sosnowskyi TaxID=360622 RepID=A0AAD8I9J6_9APIA|nr:hypothetical protein POM88_027201 [Heracleum sosnowskyi]